MLSWKKDGSIPYSNPTPNRNQSDSTLKVQPSSVAQSCPTLCNPMDCSMPGLPVHHQLPELAQTHVHWVSDAIQPSHPLSSSSPRWMLPAHIAKVLSWETASGNGFRHHAFNNHSSSSSWPHSPAPPSELSGSLLQALESRCCSVLTQDSISPGVRAGAWQPLKIGMCLPLPLRGLYFCCTALLGGLAGWWLTQQPPGSFPDWDPVSLYPSGASTNLLISLSPKKRRKEQQRAARLAHVGGEQTACWR